MRKTNSVIYGLIGGLGIVYGVLNLLLPTWLVPEAAQSFPLRHILKEQAAAAIFIGLMSLWCIFNYERRRGVHYCLVVFAFLLAAIHWSDYLAGHLRLVAPLYNSVPFLVLLFMLPQPKKA